MSAFDECRLVDGHGRPSRPRSRQSSNQIQVIVERGDHTIVRGPPLAPIGRFIDPSRWPRPPRAIIGANRLASINRQPDPWAPRDPPWTVATHPHGFTPPLIMASSVLAQRHRRENRPRRAARGPGARRRRALWSSSFEHRGSYSWQRVTAVANTRAARARRAAAFAPMHLRRPANTHTDPAMPATTCQRPPDGAPVPRVTLDAGPRGVRGELIA